MSSPSDTSAKTGNFTPAKNQDAWVVIGAGGHGAEVAAYALEMSLPLTGAVDDVRHPGPWHVTRVIGGIHDLPAFCAPYAKVHYITAFGDNALRKRMVTLLTNLNLPQLKPFTLQHPRSWMGAGVELGEGTLLAPQSLVTTRATIGNHAILNVKASVAHDCVIGDFCNINPGATLCGDVRLGEGVFIGAGAVVTQKRSIGAWTIVGAGAVVTQDLPEGVTAVGVPARIIKRQGPPPFIS